MSVSALNLKVYNTVQHRIAISSFMPFCRTKHCEEVCCMTRIFQFTS